MADNKKREPAKSEGRPKKLKDGSIKWGNKTFKNEKELETYLNNMPIVDGKKKKK